jgi:hypothetical protein
MPYKLYLALGLLQDMCVCSAENSKLTLLGTKEVSIALSTNEIFLVGAKAYRDTWPFSPIK